MLLGTKLAAINRHRAKSIQMLQASFQLEATSAVFRTVPTDYLDGTGVDSDLKVVEAARSILPRADKQEARPAQLKQEGGCGKICRPARHAMFPITSQKTPGRRWRGRGQALHAPDSVLGLKRVRLGR